MHEFIFIFLKISLFFSETRKLYNGLSIEIQKVRKDTEKEMEINEHLTSLSFRIENNIKITSRTVAMYNEKVLNSELQLVNLTKINEQTQQDYNIVFTVCLIYYIE